MKEVLKAFDKIKNICIEIVGDDCKDDLILLGTNAGITEQDLKEKYPELYERGTDNITEDDFKEGEENSEEEQPEVLIEPEE